MSRYWESVRPYYKAIDNTVSYPNPEVYIHEMPGGQYSNLQQQAKAVASANAGKTLKICTPRVHDVRRYY